MKSYKGINQNGSQGWKINQELSLVIFSFSSEERQCSPFIADIINKEVIIAGSEALAQLLSWYRHHSDLSTQPQHLSNGNKSIIHQRPSPHRSRKVPKCTNLALWLLSFCFFLTVQVGQPEYVFFLHKRLKTVSLGLHDLGKFLLQPPAGSTDFLFGFVCSLVESPCKITFVK